MTMDTVYKSKIDWWIPAVVAVTVGVAFIGPIIDGEIFIVGIIIAVLLGTLEIVMFASVKYKNMKEIIKCDECDYSALADIWERSVRATHTFLGEEDIAGIRSALIPVYFKAVSLYVILENGSIAGFMGLCGNKIEMLFVDPPYMGRGFGSRLIDFAISGGADSVDVNEQNPAALRFYMARGFKVAGREEFDEAGRPFPILHLAL